MAISRRDGSGREQAAATATGRRAQRAGSRALWFFRSASLTGRVTQSLILRQYGHDARPLMCLALGCHSYSLCCCLSLPFLHHAADKEAKVPCTSVLLSPVSVFQKLWSRRSSGVTRTVCRRSFNTFSALVHLPFSLSIPPVGKAAAVFYSIVLAALALLPSTLAPLPSLLPNSAGPLRQAPDLRLPDHT